MEPATQKNAGQAQSPAQQMVESGKNDPQNGVPAHEAAEADMQSDPDLNDTAKPDDGLDEGELARLEGEN